MGETEEIARDELGAVSRLFSLGHDPARLAELAPKIRDLFEMIHKVRAASIRGHEMAVNYPTSVPEWFEAGSEGVPLLPPEGQPPRAGG